MILGGLAIRRAAERKPPELAVRPSTFLEIN
jgi:hypothetical protein